MFCFPDLWKQTQGGCILDASSFCRFICFLLEKSHLCSTNMIHHRHEETTLRTFSSCCAPTVSASPCLQQCWRPTTAWTTGRGPTSCTSGSIPRCRATSIWRSGSTSRKSPLIPTRWSGHSRPTAMLPLFGRMVGQVSLPVLESRDCRREKKLLRTLPQTRRNWCR